MYLPKKRTHHFDIIFILALFLLFAFSSSTLILLGSQVYQSSISKMNEYFDTRTATNYVIEKIHQKDSLYGVAIENREKVCMLLLSEKIEDISYTTYLYAYEGKLYEFFARSNLTFAPEDGQAIMDIGDFTCSWYDTNIIQLHITTAQGTEIHDLVYLHTKQNL